MTTTASGVAASATPAAAKRKPARSAPSGGPAAPPAPRRKRSHATPARKPAARPRTGFLVATAARIAIAGKRQAAKRASSFRSFERIDRDAERERRHDGERAEVEKRLEGRRAGGPERQAAEARPRREERREEEEHRDREGEGGADDARRTNGRSARFPAARRRRTAGRAHGFAARTAATRTASKTTPGIEATRPSIPARSATSGSVIACGWRSASRKVKSGHSVIASPTFPFTTSCTRRDDSQKLMSASGRSESHCREGVRRPAEDEEEPGQDAQPPPAAADPDRAERRGRRERREERGDQVVGVLGRDPRGAGREREEKRAEVVVGESRARHPRVGEGEAPGRHEAGEDGEVHRLFGEADVADGPADPEVEEEDAEGQGERRPGAPPGGERVEKALPEEDDQDEEEERAERQRDAGDRDVEERRREPAGERREDQPRGEREGDGRLRAARRGPARPRGAARRPPRRPGRRRGAPARREGPVKRSRLSGKVAHPGG